MKYVWNRMNVFKNRNNTRKWNPFDDPEYIEIARTKMNKVAPCWTEETSPNWTVYQQELGLEDSRWNLDVPFCRAVLDRAIRACKDKSSPGLDGIDYRMIKYLPDVYKNSLLERMNFTFNSGQMFDD